MTGTPDPQVSPPQFALPARQFFLMVSVVMLTGAGGYILYPRVEAVLLSNLYLNGFILAVFAIGVLTCFFQLFQLFSAVRWIERFTSPNSEATAGNAPRLLASLAGLLRGRNAASQIGTTSSRSILDSVATRIDEARDITRYIVNLLIFLGLLGTFFGLATTVPAVVETIRSLDPSEGEGGIEVFARLMSGLEAQLGGMGTAFSSSLLGLAGSLVVGLLELFASHGQNRFYRELEDWLSSITRVGFASGEMEGGSFDTAVVAQVLDHMADQMETLQQLFHQSEQRAAVTDERLMNLAGSVDRMTSKVDRGEGGTPLAAALERIALGQEGLLEALRAQGAVGDNVDAESRMRLRSIDVQLLRILEEMAAGRQESVAELRGELSSLNRALRQSIRVGGSVASGETAEQRASAEDEEVKPKPAPKRRPSGRSRS